MLGITMAEIRSNPSPGPLFASHAVNGGPFLIQSSSLKPSSFGSLRNLSERGWLLIIGAGAL